MGQIHRQLRKIVINFQLDTFKKPVTYTIHNTHKKYIIKDLMQM